MQDKISIIVPIYNIEGYVDKCVRSIVGQTYKNIEIILVDDGSTDNSGAMCDKWAAEDPRIIVLHKENEGLSDARNSGLEIATGKYVGFIDGDDWLAEDMYEYLHRLIADNDADISICEHYVEDENGNLSEDGVLNSNIDILSKTEAIHYLIQDEVLHSFAWDKLYKRELFDGVTYPTRRYVQDMFTTYKVFLKSEKIVYGHEPKYYYFQRSNSIQRTRGEKLDWDQFSAYKEWYENLSDKYPELKAYLLRTWMAFTVCAYNSVLLRTEVGAETKTRKQIMLNTLKEYYRQLSLWDNFSLKLRMAFIKYKGYDSIYPKLKMLKR